MQVKTVGPYEIRAPGNIVDVERSRTVEVSVIARPRPDLHHRHPAGFYGSSSNAEGKSAATLNQFRCGLGQERCEARGR